MKLLPELDKVNSDAIFTDYKYYNDQSGKIKRRYMHRTNHYVKHMKRMYRHM
jgi:hypothetical protein